MTAPLKERIIYPQWIAGFGVTMLVIQVGFMGGWASPTLAKLSAPDSAIPIDPDQASWIGSLMNAGRIFGAVTGPAAAHYWGSRRAMIATLLPMAIGWLFISFANVVEWLYTARLFNGVGLGMAFAVFPLYIGEVSMPGIRGALMSLASVGAPFGQVVSSICGAYMPMSAASSLYLALALLLMGLFFYLPESPHHLVKVGDREGAEKSISWYRVGRGVDMELAAVEKLISADGTKSFIEKLEEFRRPAIWKAVLKMMILVSFESLCGLNVIMFFMETILERANFNLISPSDVVIYINISCIFSSIIAMCVIDRYGRLFLLSLSGLGTAVAMFGLMSHFLLMNDSNVGIENLQWLPVTSMFLFMVSYFGGFFIVPSTILGEIFPTNVKCIVACMTILASASTSFLSTKSYQPMVDVMGEAYVFLIYAIICLLSIPYSIFIIPETKGKSLQQIQDEMA